MLPCQIKCMPGSYQRKLSYQRAVQLVRSATPALSVAARPSSLKHAAIKAEHNAKRPSLQKSTINFSCAIPFNAIPQLIEDRFQQQENQFRKGNQGILEHYQTARQCLTESLGDPLCDLMLMLVLTLALLSVTPTIAPAAYTFSLGTKKNSAMFTANLVTRML
jgi:hypothetical protein